jgi:hypothetical protein
MGPWTCADGEDAPVTIPAQAFVMQEGNRKNSAKESIDREVRALRRWRNSIVLYHLERDVQTIEVKIASFTAKRIQEK